MVGTAIPTAGKRLAVPQLNSLEATFFGPMFSSRLVFVIAFLLTLNHMARPFERFLVGYKIPFVLCCIGIVVALVNRPLEMLSHRLIQYLVAYSAWMVVCLMFSVWRGGSATYVQNFLTLQLPFVFLVAAAPLSFNHVRTIMWATAIGVAFSLLTGAKETGQRLASTGTFGNSDDVALIAGFAMPLGVTFALKYKTPFIRYLLLAVIVGFYLRSIGLTATRTAIPALACMAAVYFFRSTLFERMLLVFGSVVALIVMLLTLPESALQRFSTIIDSFDQSAVLAQARNDEAFASAAERRDLVNDGFAITFANPLFGAGPGNYGVYRNMFFKRADGRPKRLFPSHNTFLQISSEEGIPGFLLYVGFLYAIWQNLKAARRNNAPGMHPDWETGQMIVTNLEAVFAYFVFCAIFMTCDKHPHQFLLAGLSVAMSWISASYARQAAVARASAAHGKPAVTSAKTPPSAINGWRNAFPPGFRPVRPAGSVSGAQ